MARPYGDDLRCKFLLAYDEGAGTLEEPADRFLVSEGWVKKVSAQRNRTGQAERVPHQPRRKLRAQCRDAASGDGLGGFEARSEVRPVEFRHAGAIGWWVARRYNQTSLLTS